MRLTNLQVLNFRCIEDSEKFTLPKVTCLVGKNEAGKTALLQALYRFKPDREDQTFDLIRDYPRRKLSDYEPTHEGNQAQILETTWHLSDEDIAALEEIVGSEATKNREVTVSARYPEKKVGPPQKSWGVKAAESAVVAHVIDKSALHDEERESLKGAKTIGELKALLVEPATERHTELRAFLDKYFKRGEATLAVVDFLTVRVPTFVYFSQYDALQGRMHLQTLQQKRKEGKPLASSERLFLDLCEFAGSNLDELASIDSFEALKARFEAAQSKITEQIFEYWTTNTYLAVEFTRDEGLPADPPPYNSGRVFNTRIKNELHGNTVPFDDRSTGFVWFFSFLVLFSQVRKRFGSNVILLLDEPGLNLHAQAQADLLRYIKEKLEPEHQVIYTTHSLFMVPPDDLLRARLVEDVIVERPRMKPEVKGTKVRTDVLRVTNETLFPLQGALGFEISQTLFVGKHTLIVEGPSDLLYITAYSQALREVKRTSLDQRWTICPVGGLDKVPAFLALFGRKLNVAAVLDLATGGKGKIAEAKKLAEDLLRQGRVFTFAEFTGKSESDVEDMMGLEGYAALVSKTYGLSPALVPPSTPPSRVLPWVEGELRVRAAAPDFNHYDPAEHLVTNRVSTLPVLPGASDALNRFEALFAKLNALLK